MTSVVDTFVEDWPERQYFWEALTKAARTICEDGVHKRLKLKCNIYSRTKSEESIRGSIERRQKKREKPYQTKEEIEQDMIDLAGIRIILTFPGDVDEVQKWLETEFDDLRRYFWGLDENGNAVTREEKGRFIGYRATHFVVKWKKDAEHAYGTNQRHAGRQIEIQVTSTAMYAWQQAHHDLCYKQLQGQPSADERMLLEMINGLAHAGEMALSQLQTLSKRRIEEDTREFADEYEVGVWLKTHLQSLLAFKSPVHAPFLERSSVLFDIMSLLNLCTPAKLRDVLTSTPDMVDLYAQDERFGEILHQTTEYGYNEDLWTKIFHSDSVDWAIFRICAYNWGESGNPNLLKGIRGARIKAFCLVNTINFALSDPSRHDFIHAVLQDILDGYHPKGDIRGAMNTMSSLLTDRAGYAMLENLGFIRNDQASRDHESALKEPEQTEDMWCIWLGLLKCILVRNSTFLCLALMISLAGFVFLPEAEQPLFLSGNSSQFIIWPFNYRPSESLVTNSIELGVTCMSNGESRKYKLANLKWRLARVSLDLVANGSGWGPPTDGESVGVQAVLRFKKYVASRFKSRSVPEQYGQGSTFETIQGNIECEIEDRRERLTWYREMRHT